MMMEEFVFFLLVLSSRSYRQQSTKNMKYDSSLAATACAFLTRRVLRYPGPHPCVVRNPAVVLPLDFPMHLSG